MYSDILVHLEEDSHRFGQSTWELFGADRIRQFEQTLAGERIQLKQAKQDKLKHQQDKIQQEVKMQFGSNDLHKGTKDQVYYPTKLGMKVLKI